MKHEDYVIDLESGWISVRSFFFARLPQLAAMCKPRSILLEMYNLCCGPKGITRVDSLQLKPFLGFIAPSFKATSLVLKAVLPANVRSEFNCLVTFNIPFSFWLDSRDFSIRDRFALKVFFLFLFH